jgi:TolA-binding protein
LGVNIFFAILLFEIDLAAKLTYKSAIMNDKVFNILVVPGVVVLLGLCLPLRGVLAQGAASEDQALREELKYIELLQQMRMPDIAEEVIAETKQRFPEAAPQLKVREIQGLLWQGKFDDVKKVIDAMPDKNSAEYWALNLAMADSYYAFGRYAEADKLYLGFFKKVEKPGPALVTFFRDAAYKYAQMLLYLGKEREGLAAYRRLFTVPLDEDVERNVQADMAELMLKLAPETTNKKEQEAMLKEAETLVDKLLWKQDVWFGKAIVMKAHIYLLRSDVTGAQELVENYMPQLRIIHDSLREQDKDGSQGMLRMSPMPQCRYLLAVLLMDAAVEESKKDTPNEERIKDLFLGERDPQTRQRKGNGAFNHFINVFIRFPESQWAAEAGERSDAIRKIIKDRYGVELRTPVTAEQMAKVRQMQFAGARLEFSQNRFKEAAEKYLLVLNQFPETPESMSALGDLAISYMEVSANDAEAMLMAETVAAHLSERFSANEKLAREAGDQVRRIGDRFGEMKMEDKKRQIYAMFFRDYPEHYAAGQLVMSFGEREYQAQNYKGALEYYNQITTTYTNSPYYYDALNRIAQIHKEEGRHQEEIDALEFYVEKVAARPRPGQALVTGRFRLADAYREYGNVQLREWATNTVAEAEQREAGQRAAVTLLTKAALGFGGVVSMLSGEGAAAYHSNAEEKQRNEQMAELALFTKAVCLTQINYPADRLPALRKMAIASFEDYVKSYPQGRYAPRAQLQIGTLYTILEDVPNSQAAFEKLSKNYPESAEAKNSVPMLAAALIDMGLRGEGVAKYRQMFAVDGTYTEGQFMAAATALEEAKEYDLALQAYDKVLAATKDVSLKAGAMLGRARSLRGQKKFSEARKLLEEFIKDSELSKLQLVVDANMLLVEVASEEGKDERDDNERTKLFNLAVDSLKMVKRYRTEPKELAEMDLMAGEMLLRKMAAEKALKLEAQAAETRGKAIVAFQVLIMNLDPGNVSLAGVLEKAYYYCLPLLLEHKKYRDAEEDCQKYLELFPNGRWTTDVRNWLNQARIGQ